MALDKFKTNLSIENAENILQKKWKAEVIRVKDEIFKNFSSYLETEGFSISKHPSSVQATYQTAVISISLAHDISCIDQYNAPNLPAFHIRYNKWRPESYLFVNCYANNQIIAEGLKKNDYSKNHEVTKNIELLTNYINNFKKITYDFTTTTEEDLSKSGVFGKLFFHVQDAKIKEFNTIKDIINATLNDEISFKHVW